MTLIHEMGKFAQRMEHIRKQTSESQLGRDCPVVEQTAEFYSAEFASQSKRREKGFKEKE